MSPVMETVEGNVASLIVTNRRYIPDFHCVNSKWEREGRVREWGMRKERKIERKKTVSSMRLYENRNAKNPYLRASLISTIVQCFSALGHDPAVHAFNRTVTRHDAVSFSIFRLLIRLSHDHSPNVASHRCNGPMHGCCCIDNVRGHKYGAYTAAGINSRWDTRTVITIMIARRNSYTGKYTAKVAVQFLPVVRGWARVPMFPTENISGRELRLLNVHVWYV